MHPLGIDTSVSTPILRIQRAYANSSFRWRIPFKALWDVHKLQRLTMSYSQRPHLLFCFCRRVTTIGNILSQSVIHFGVAAKYKANTPNERIPKSKITIVKHQFMCVTWGKKTDEIFHFRELNNKTMLRTMIKIFHCFGFLFFIFIFFLMRKQRRKNFIMNGNLCVCVGACKRVVELWWHLGYYARWFRVNGVMESGRKVEGKIKFNISLLTWITYIYGSQIYRRFTKLWINDINLHIELSSWCYTYTVIPYSTWCANDMCVGNWKKAKKEI